MRFFGVWRFGSHREPDDFLVEVVAESGVDDERRAIEAAAAFAERRNTATLATSCVSRLRLRKVNFSVQVALEIAGNASRRAGLERTGADDVATISVPEAPKDLARKREHDSSAA